MPQKNAPFKPIKVKRPKVASAVVVGATDQAKAPRMTETPGVLALGYAAQQDGLQYHFSAAHHGRYFYREFGSVFTSPGKLVILEVQVKNVGKPDDFVYPAMAVSDTPVLSVQGKTIAPFSVTMQQTLPGHRKGNAFRMLFMYDYAPQAKDILTVSGVGLAKSITLR